MYDKLEYYLSESKLRPYLELANNDNEKAVELYKLDLRCSSDLYSLMSIIQLIIY